MSRADSLQATCDPQADPVSDRLDASGASAEPADYGVITPIKERTIIKAARARGLRAAPRYFIRLAFRLCAPGGWTSARVARNKVPGSGGQTTKTRTCSRVTPSLQTAQRNPALPELPLLPEQEPTKLALESDRGWRLGLRSKKTWVTGPRVAPAPP